MTRVNGFIVFVFMSMVMLPSLATADDKPEKLGLSLGAGVSVSTSEYKGDGTGITPIPLLNYEGEYLFVRGLSAGAHLYKDDANEVSLVVSYLSQSFDASESDNRAMQRLDDRDSSMSAGAAYSLRTDWGTAKLSLVADVLGTSNGFIADASYAYPFKYSFLKLKPVAGIEWTSGDYNDYYYGVDANESLRSGLSGYEAESGFSPYLGLSVKIGLAQDFDLMLSTKTKWLSKEITDSPMVDRDVNHSFAAGLTYSF